ncbi:MAG: hypothetical protein M1450_02580 [Patescibacteria group bacterium]|nr:hypothetical protein [Patescibacteria group bacterium]
MTEAVDRKRPGQNQEVSPISEASERIWQGSAHITEKRGMSAIDVSDVFTAILLEPSTPSALKNKFGDYTKDCLGIELFLTETPKVSKNTKGVHDALIMAAVYVVMTRESPYQLQARDILLGLQYGSKGQLQRDIREALRLWPDKIIHSYKKS